MTSRNDRDDRMRDDISERLARHGEIDARQIEIEVRGSEVTLTGAVDSPQARRAAERVAEAVSGVSQVHNQLRVHQQGQASDAEQDAERMDRAAQAGNTGAFGASPTGSQTEQQMREDAQRAFGDTGRASR